ncbi:hypothetical protein CX918_003760 [Escherichia coli]|nr:hypothetical protein [Escherichia coli]EIH2185279.1 hypothetical protein [Escherichia coli]EIL3176298.1 hypothetical protein [Escherichia coli]ELK1196068.1 hypothetical protein [Escherichia coli]
MFLQERPCSVLSNCNQLLNPEKRRDGYNIGRYATECGERIFTRTVRQVKQQTTVHYFVSPPRPPVKTNPQAKTLISTRLEVATRKKRRVLFI